MLGKSAFVALDRKIVGPVLPAARALRSTNDKIGSGSPISLPPLRVPATRPNQCAKPYLAVTFTLSPMSNQRLDDLAMAGVSASRQARCPAVATFDICTPIKQIANVLDVPAMDCIFPRSIHDSKDSRPFILLIEPRRSTKTKS